MAHNGLGYNFVVVLQFCLAFIPSVPKSDRKGAGGTF